MTDPFGLPSRPARFVLVLLFTCALVLASVPGLAGPAAAADPRLEKAQERKEEVQEQLDDIAARIEKTRAEVEETRNEIEQLREKESRHNDQASDSSEERIDRLRESYKRGHTDPLLQLLTAEDETDVIEQARFMAWLATESQKDVEAATADAVRADALADHTQELVERLREREQKLEEEQEEAEQLLEEAIQAEEDVKALIAREKAAARRAAQARAAAAASSSSAAAPSGGSGGGSGSTPVRGGVACPVGTPRSYIDSWGAPRSGGRSHKGTDILAPRGTPTPAYESGVVSRMSSNSLGGISLYIRGDSGNLYYYTHLSGYAGVSVGQRVSAGQVVAYVGATGNARGINHLHFEVRPGGGGNVNPYPYVRRACG